MHSARESRLQKEKKKKLKVRSAQSSCVPSARTFLEFAHSTRWDCIVCVPASFVLAYALCRNRSDETVVSVNSSTVALAQQSNAQPKRNCSFFRRNLVFVLSTVGWPLCAFMRVWRNATPTMTVCTALAFHAFFCLFLWWLSIIVVERAFLASLRVDSVLPMCVPLKRRKEKLEITGLFEVGICIQQNYSTCSLLVLEFFAICSQFQNSPTCLLIIKIKFSFEIARVNTHHST